MTTATIIANEKGGTGKSTVTCLLGQFYKDFHGHWPRIVEVDRPRLAEVLGDEAVTSSIKPWQDFEKVLDDPSAYVEHFNAISHELTVGDDAIVDTGANVWPSLIDWIDDCDLPDMLAADGIDAQCVFVAAPNPDAIQSAMNNLEQARELFDEKASYAIVLNNTDGSGFERFNGLKVMSLLNRMAENREIELVEIPHCQCRLAKHVSARYLPLTDGFYRFDHHADAMGLDRPSRVQQFKRIKTWTERAHAAVKPLIPESEHAAA